MQSQVSPQETKRCAPGARLTALGSLPSGSQVGPADQRETYCLIGFPLERSQLPQPRGCLSPGPFFIP